jgi:hypothetical protein
MTSNKDINIGVNIDSLKFNSANLDSLDSLDLQANSILSWLSHIIIELKKVKAIDGDLQHTIVGELAQLLGFVQKPTKKDPQVLQWTCLTKALRGQIGTIYKLLYDMLKSSGSTKDLYETVNNYLNFLGAGKPDKYTELKQWVN